MLKREIVFGACPAMTPGFAARLAQLATEVKSEVCLERGGTRLCVDSLISILSMDLRQGTHVTVCTEGADEAEAAERVCALLAGKG